MVCRDESRDLTNFVDANMSKKNIAQNAIRIILKKTAFSLGKSLLAAAGKRFDISDIIAWRADTFGIIQIL